MDEEHSWAKNDYTVRMLFLCETQISVAHMHVCLESVCMCGFCFVLEIIAVIIIWSGY